MDHLLSVYGRGAVRHNIDRTTEVVVPDSEHYRRYRIDAAGTLTLEESWPRPPSARIGGALRRPAHFLGVLAMLVWWFADVAYRRYALLAILVVLVLMPRERMVAVAGGAAEGWFAGNDDDSGDGDGDGGDGGD